MKGTMPSVTSPRTPQHQIERVHREGCSVTTLEQPGCRELHISIWPRSGEHFSSLIQRLSAILKGHDATVVKQQVFGALDLRDESLRLTKLMLGAINWPVTWVEGFGAEGPGIAGMHVLAVAGPLIERIVVDGKVLGCAFENAFARQVILAGIVPADTFCSSAAQVRQVYDQMEFALSKAGTDLQHLVRTWFFLDRITSWYGDFNKVRNLIYEKIHRQQPFLPASTGVGVRLNKDVALMGEAWALQPLDGPVSVREIASPLQCGAPQYGSSFSRAAEVRTPGLSRLTVSGTASIDGNGCSIHPGDVKKQIEQTMRVVEGILRSRGRSFADSTRATAYFKNIADVRHFTAWCDDQGLSLPVVLTQADICRDELLFEIELDAAAIPQ